MSELPLHTCRVLDLGIITAGAATSALLADMGAEVIKIESPTYRDPFRLWVSEDGKSTDMPTFFRATNRNKAGVSLDLKHPDGRAAFLRLVAQSDVVVENFRRGVLERLGLGYEALRAVNPDVVLASVSSQGETGPDAGQVSYGTTLEAVGGLAWLSGYEGGDPVVSGRELNYPDQVAALFAAGMIATSWRASKNGGGGVHLDISQRELTSFLCGEAFLRASSEAQEAPARHGNAQAPFALQDCFLAKDGAWVALSIKASAHEAALALLRPSEPATDLREACRAFVAARSAEEAAAALQGGGIAAGVVLDGRGVLKHRGNLWREALIDAPDGAILKGFPFQFAQTPMHIARDAPPTGSSTLDVLTRIAGYTPEEVAALESRGVVETVRSD